jgi:hypothetical protein
VEVRPCARWRSADTLRDRRHSGARNRSGCTSPLHVHRLNLLRQIKNALADCHAAQGALGDDVIDLGMTIAAVTDGRRPAIERVLDRSGRVRFRGKGSLVDSNRRFRSSSSGTACAWRVTHRSSGRLVAKDRLRRAMSARDRAISQIPVAGICPAFSCGLVLCSRFLWYR